MNNKVYAITVDFTDTTWVEVVENTFKIDAEIQKLAKKSGADVHMHQYKAPMGSAPEVLIEAPAAFIEKVKQLSLVGL
jgi:hypothetical protein